MKIVSYAEFQREVRYRPKLQDFGVRTAEEVGWGRDFTLEMQKALDAMYERGGGILYAPRGHYRCEKRLRARPRVHIQGENRDSVTTFNFYGKDNNEAFLVDGADGVNSWIFDFSISKVRFELNGFTGANTTLMKVRQAYSCIFDEFTLGSVTEDYTPLTVGYVNDCRFGNLIVGGVDEAPLLGPSVLVDSSLGPVNKLRFVEPDIEVGSMGFKFQGSGRLVAEIISMYTEQLDTNVYWDAADTTHSHLFINGGIILGKNGATGVDIRRSNCTVMGLVMNNSGAIGVDIDNAVSHANTHVIGGHYATATKVRDSNGWLTTNSFP